MNIAVFWDAWVPQITTRILRDMMDIQRLANSNRSVVTVMCDDVLIPKLQALGIQAHSRYDKPDMTMVYIARGDVTPPEVQDRVDPECPVVTPVYLNIPGPGIGVSPLVVDPDPYGGVKFYKDWEHIPETMPLGRPAPKRGKHDEPMWSPWL